MTGTTAARSPSGRSLARAIAVIVAVSAAASLFLFWLIYLHPAADQGGVRMAFLPTLNAISNGLCAVALVTGYVCVRARRIVAHRASMITAFGFSVLFLVGYIAHHALHGDVRYPAEAPLRTFYLSLLASHILLAVVALPLVLVTFFFSLSGRIPLHRKVARCTLPVWLYVSLTGVVTYAMLRLARG
jgi:putative membrane protein